MAPANPASSVSSTVQKPHFCPSPECEVGVESSQLRQACECCTTPISVKLKWSGTGRGAHSFLALDLNLRSLCDVAVSPALQLPCPRIPVHRQETE